MPEPLASTFEPTPQTSRCWTAGARRSGPSSSRSASGSGSRPRTHFELGPIAWIAAEKRGYRAERAEFGELSAGAFEHVSEPIARPDALAEDAEFEEGDRVGQRAAGEGGRLFAMRVRRP